MHQSDYDSAAATYAEHRWSLPWKLSILAECLKSLTPHIAIEIGCGTADYTLALRNRFPNVTFIGFDKSREMLRIAQQRQPDLHLLLADANECWPFRASSASLLYAIDVLQHVTALTKFFGEARRVLGASGKLVIITDSQGDIRARSLAKFFPETIPINMERYPSVSALVLTIQCAGFRIVQQQPCAGEIPIDDKLVATLQNKALSELRLISQQSHHAGMQRVSQARAHGEKWLSQTTALVIS